MRQKTKNKSDNGYRRSGFKQWALKDGLKWCTKRRLRAQIRDDNVRMGGLHYWGS